MRGRVCGRVHESGSVSGTWGRGCSVGYRESGQELESMFERRGVCV